LVAGFDIPFVYGTLPNSQRRYLCDNSGTVGNGNNVVINTSLSPPNTIKGVSGSTASTAGVVAVIAGGEKKPDYRNKSDNA
jgi:hypothetical protein